MGLESGDPQILKNIKKGATVEEEGHPLPHVEMPGLTRKDYDGSRQPLLRGDGFRDLQLSCS